MALATQPLIKVLVGQLVDERVAVVKVRALSDVSIFVLPVGLKALVVVSKVVKDGSLVGVAEYLICGIDFLLHQLKPDRSKQHVYLKAFGSLGVIGVPVGVKRETELAENTADFSLRRVSRDFKDEVSENGDEKKVW